MSFWMCIMKLKTIKMKSLKKIFEEQSADLTKTFNTMRNFPNRVYKIDVGQIKPEDVDEYIRKVVATFKKEVILPDEEWTNLKLKKGQILKPGAKIEVKKLTAEDKELVKKTIKEQEEIKKRNKIDPDSGKTFVGNL